MVVVVTLPRSPLLSLMRTMRTDLFNSFLEFSVKVHITNYIIRFIDSNFQIDLKVKKHLFHFSKK